MGASGHLFSTHVSRDKYSSLEQEYGGGKDPVRPKDRHQNLPSQCKREEPEIGPPRMGKRAQRALVFGRELVFDPLAKETGGHLI